MNKKLIFALGIAFAALPLAASAQTLTASVAAGSGVASPIASAHACVAFSRSLSVGVTGSDVTDLQTYLNAHGYLKVSPTGYFGPLTKAAVASWQADGSVAAKGSAGSGIFGPLSRAYFIHSCGGGSTLGIRPGFYANPQAGSAPLTVQFISSQPAGTALGNAVNFGDGSTGNLAFAPTCFQCNPSGTVSHTYANPGTYTASLTSGSCACPADGVCNCPMISILATTTVTVAPASSTSTIKQVNAPASVTLSAGGIAEVRNEHYYFTLEGTTSTSATIQPTAVGCWNSFPSDPPPEVRCMIAVMPLAPQTLSVGQAYVNGNFNLSLTQLTSDGQATFSVGVPPVTASGQ